MRLHLQPFLPRLSNLRSHFKQHQRLSPSAQCCAPEKSCTPTGCQYLHPHFCGNGSNRKNCGVNGRCVKSPTETCCDSKCVVPAGPAGSGLTQCCAPEETCTPSGCKYIRPHFCGTGSHRKRCGSTDSCIDGKCCPEERACGPKCCPVVKSRPKGDFVDTRS